MQLNINIKLIRELSGKKQEDFAKLIKTNVSNLKTYERTGTRPKAPVLHRISQIAGISMDDLENKKLTPHDIRFKVEKDDPGDTRQDEVREDYLSGKNLENFSEAQRKLSETNSQLATAIVHAQSGSRQDHGLVPSLVDLIQEIAGGKKQVPIDELLTQLRKALVRDNGYT